jgi:hypothetical protein
MTMNDENQLSEMLIRNGPLWDNRVEDSSAWFFTRAGDA